MILFGLVQIVFSQIPDFDQIWWLSIVAAVMSFTYSGIGLSLGIAQTICMSLTNQTDHIIFLSLSLEDAYLPLELPPMDGN
jgi:hypothetical protein